MTEGARITDADGGASASVTGSAVSGAVVSAAFGGSTAADAAEKRGKGGDGAAVVAAGGGPEPQGPEPLGDHSGQVVERGPLRLATQALAQHPVRGPRCTQDLERRQPHPAGLVLDQHPPHPGFGRQGGHVAQRRGRVAGEAPVEGVDVRPRPGTGRHGGGAVVEQQARRHGRVSTPPEARSPDRNGQDFNRLLISAMVVVVTVRFTLNGSRVEVGDHPHLLAALREELDVTSPKDGCSPTGQCGCCTVVVDGKPTVSCSLALDRVDGRRVTTLEGLDPAERDRYAAAFAATGALQCGFCTPGIVVRAKYLVDKDGPALTREKAARHLGGHLCRCTGYHAILDAVELLSAGGDVPVPWPAATATGGSTARGAATWGLRRRTPPEPRGQLAPRG